MPLEQCYKSLYNSYNQHQLLQAELTVCANAFHQPQQLHLETATSNVFVAIWSHSCSVSEAL